MSRSIAAEKVIYIVDDDATIRRSLEHLLRAAGFGTVSYATPSEFPKVAADLPAGCALLDVLMPEMEWVRASTASNLDEGRAAPYCRDRQGDVKVAVRAMKAGAVDFIEKPYERENADQCPR